MILRVSDIHRDGMKTLIYSQEPYQLQFFGLMHPIIVVRSLQENKWILVNPGIHAIIWCDSLQQTLTIQLFRLCILKHFH